MSSEFRQLAERVGKEWGESMAEYWAQEKALGMAQDMAQGMAKNLAREERKKNAKRLIEAGKISVKEALDFFDLPPEMMTDLV